MARLRVVNLVCDGDSNTAGFGTITIDTEAWPVVIEGMLTDDDNEVRQWSVKSVAVSGHQTQTRINAFPTDVRPLFNANYGLNVLTFWEATNDFRTAGLSVAAVIEQTIEYSRMAMFDGWSLQLITPPRNTHTSNSKILEFNEWLLSPEARPYSTFPVLDIASDERLVDPTDTDYWQADGLHPNAAGYAVIAELVHGRLLEL